MKVHRIVSNVSWLKLQNQFQVIEDNWRPPLELITSVHALCFEDSRMLMVKHAEAGRSWDIPGGHIELGETPEQAVIREAFEEARVVIQDVRQLGYVQVDILEPKPKEYAYPYPTSYMLLFGGKITKVDQFNAEHETLDRDFFEPARAVELEWVKENPEIYQLALRQVIQ